MPKGESLGEFEHIVLLAILRLGELAYGMRIRQEIHARTGRDSAIGAVYATLDRMAEKGLVTSEMGEATAERGGRAKRFFRVTAEGVELLNRARRDLASMMDGLPSVTQS
ncbi:MAG: PadR family transcriptional regulator [Bryobacteraceae bacterium]|nr:PadR family transcriptional regulator [Bryobacteraceae bacterium]